MLHKLINLRIFNDENDKTNLKLSSINGELLIVSQYTLYADCKHGNRLSFIDAEKPDMAKNLYEYIISKCKESVPKVEHGEFGVAIKVSIVNIYNLAGFCQISVRYYHENYLRSRSDNRRQSKQIDQQDGYRTYVTKYNSSEDYRERKGL